MAPDMDFVNFVVDQMSDAGAVRYRMMFGGCTVYCQDKVVALICDNQLFIKPTDAGRSYIGEVVEAPPYTGAKPFFLIEEQVEDRDWLCELVRRTEAELPKPKPKKKKKKK
jgi:TfoX/Sxy family transcriptional regulator of competence genes